MCDLYDYGREGGLIMITNIEKHEKKRRGAN